MNRIFNSFLKKTMPRRHPVIRRAFFYVLLAVGVCAMPIANQYQGLAQFGSSGQFRPLAPTQGQLPGCRALPDEKNHSEALDRSSRDPKHCGTAMASTALWMITTSLTPQSPVAHRLLDIANGPDHQPRLQSVRLLI